MYAGVPRIAPFCVRPSGTSRERVSGSGAGGIAAPGCAVEATRIVGAEAGQPEVDHAHLAVVRDHDVVGFEVAVDHAALVRRRQAARRRQEDAQDLPHRALLSLQPVGQRVPLDQLHRDEHAVGERAHVIDHHDVGIGDLGGGLRLADEA